MRDRNEIKPELSHRILVIDDNEAIHSDFRKILGGDADTTSQAEMAKAAFFGVESDATQRGAFEIDSAFQGRQGLEMVQQALSEERPYAMAFVDIRMPPGWDGIETVKRIWAEYPELQVVLCTAYSDYSWDQMVGELIHTDRFLILKKPFDLIEVRQLATALTRKWQLAQQARLKLGELETMVEARTAELKHSEAHMRAIVESADECIVSIDHEGRIIEFNPAAEKTFGYSREEVIGKRMAELIIPPSLREKHCCGLERFLATGDSSVLGKRLELVAMRQDGGEFPVEITLNVVQNQEHPIFTALLHDISERKQMEEQLRHDALHDALTELPNRTLFVERVDHAIRRSERRYDYLFAVMFLDLDRFKNINDSLGHLVGDKLLVETARRLERCIRASDTVARLGGDEFAVLVDDIQNVTDAARIAERIRGALARSFKVDDEEFYTGASVGVALSSTGYVRAEEILRDADTAMYEAKARGDVPYVLFNSKMHARAKAILSLENDLRRALERGEFRNVYQPIVSLETGRTVSFEALLRWQHPERGLLPPSEFLTVAEDSGLLLPIGWLMFREACRQLRQWREQTPGNDSLTVSVNFSPMQIIQHNVVDRICEILRETDIGPQGLVLEVTESAVIENARLAAATLSRLKDLGIRLSIDDFGTGYASLSYLQRFPFDTLKIDRSLVGGMHDDEGNWHITQTIVTLAHNLRMDVVAEGVEVDDQRTRLETLNCDYGQGYLFSRPLAPDAVCAWLANQAVSARDELATAKLASG